MNKLVKAWIKKYNMIELVYGVDTLLNEKERMWKNPQNKNMWYSETEIKEYIGLMDLTEIKELKSNFGE